MNTQTRIAGHRRTAGWLVVVVALVLSAAPVAAQETAPAQASVPEEVSGTFTAPPPVPASLREADGNCFVEIPGDTFVLDGALAGALVLDFRIHFHSPCSAIGFPAEFHATGTFTGSATLGGAQRSGSFDVGFNGRIDEQAVARGRATIRHGTGGLEGIHGVLDFEGTPGVGGVYAGRVHLDAGG